MYSKRHINRPSSTEQKSCKLALTALRITVFLVWVVKSVMLRYYDLHQKNSNFTGSEARFEVKWFSSNFLHSSLLNVTIKLKQLLKLYYIFQSYRQNKTAPFMAHSV